MNGAHRHTSTPMIEISGKCPSQFGETLPGVAVRRAQFTTPKFGLSIMFFHVKPAATGMTRNGVISIVRTMARPGNRWFTNSA